METAVYEKVGKMVSAEILTNFEEISAQIGKHNLCAAMGMAFETLAARIAKPGSWRVDELGKLAALLGIENILLLQMAERLRAPKKKGKK
jgi:hypothetical protein